MKAGLLPRPKDLIATPIGEVNKLRLTDFYDSCPLVIEACVMSGYNRIVRRNFLQFVAGNHSAGNYRIWIH